MNNFLSGYNFARKCDVVFSETISENSTHKTYVVDYFELNNDDIIFCKTDNVLRLFEILKNEDDVKNVKLITHESDYQVNKELFQLKPKCISKWYAINVNYEHTDLIPIPLGLANDYCSITLKFNDIIKEGVPKKLLYINHRVATNIEKRKWIYDYFEPNKWCSIDNPNLTLIEYKKKLDEHKFILCPFGNGIDTHRLWESIYHGIIPIVESHIHYKLLEELPAIVVSSFREIDENFLDRKFNEITNRSFNLNKLYTDWWISSIKNNLI
jgi:hypothetical protein